MINSLFHLLVVSPSYSLVLVFAWCLCAFCVRATFSPNFRIFDQCLVMSLKTQIKCQYIDMKSSHRIKIYVFTDTQQTLTLTVYTGFLDFSNSLSGHVRQLRFGCDDQARTFLTRSGNGVSNGRLRRCQKGLKTCSTFCLIFFSTSQTEE